MHAQIESLIEGYLTRNGTTGIFLCPQFHVKYDVENREGGADPDFVALDFKNKKIIVVEVTTAYNISTLVGRVLERETRWFNPIVRQLVADKVIPDPDKSAESGTWTPRFLGFVKAHAIEVARANFKGIDDVSFADLGRSIFDFDYEAPVP